jgi:hypothetical protein
MKSHHPDYFRSLVSVIGKGDPKGGFLVGAQVKSKNRVVADRGCQFEFAHEFTSVKYVDPANVEFRARALEGAVAQEAQARPDGMSELHPNADDLSFPDPPGKPHAGFLHLVTSLLSDLDLFAFSHFRDFFFSGDVPKFRFHLRHEV